MKKIPTIFNRDWDGNRKVIPEYSQEFDFSNALATEKLDGTNVRVTVRNHTCVRLEKRRNPDKIQKHKGIEEPWYVDADLVSPQDKHIADALQNTNLDSIPDGEWSGEAIGKDIQGNPLGLDKNIIVLFSCGQAPIFPEGVPTTYEELKTWLSNRDSLYGTGKIEGVVWHWADGKMAKIKTKDF